MKRSMLSSFRSSGTGSKSPLVHVPEVCQRSEHLLPGSALPCQVRMVASTFRYNGELHGKRWQQHQCPHSLQTVQDLQTVLCEGTLALLLTMRPYRLHHTLRSTWTEV